MRNRKEKITLAKRPMLRMPQGSIGAVVVSPWRRLVGIRGLVAAAIVLGGGYALSQTYGLPAVHYAYDYRGGGYGQPRYKTACRYISPYGVHERSATGGHCPWVVLTREASR